jgi:hypothetical protein
VSWHVRNGTRLRLKLLGKEHGREREAYRYVRTCVFPAEQRIFPLVSVSRPAFEAHPASYPMGTGGPFPGSKARSGRDADHSPHLVPRSRMNRSYKVSSLKRLHGVRDTLFLYFLRTEFLNIAYTGFGFRRSYLCEGANGRAKKVLAQADHQQEYNAVKLGFSGMLEMYLD